MYYVYLLKLNNQKIYVGFTTNLEQRFKEHISRKSPYTKKYLPIKLVSYFSFNNKKTALKFEKYLKSGSGIAFRNKHLV
ncbi:excinuclease ABC subunit C [Candidatus Woesebacteria bacterium GWC2_33_12]|uniref:Excinuclease ABC C subunit domain-containing protein n=1 Tax=Candidatus Woesebacteria bacterium GW2011_GWB1_33_22 TaxID=1618566 RepID=A0A0G0C241_9BACT|nr:MAG: excinuclease ABC C subunit domain-containing protein [Candidatus Woesebacteria bacterium GW2011_GWC2_33_12]KKP42452.1 MAG: excinuclease ABC C subunit domain-containing protein [Candidatus Woesebacteria bacterium GW2011_GWA2_33_20]KKP45195.1 MAG: excinuclease ABC C subunit domain-containing protein [Candidatus Woesebacteria bacterium GW2011_GWB1_33_22]KKP46194.1 MAG: Excinuclease ABC C subunit domain protein [Microgenomates group bacterium GW2011_GWC1_33_28]KKP50864.1 MAG: excinuclease A